MYLSQSSTLLSKLKNTELLKDNSINSISLRR